MKKSKKISHVYDVKITLSNKEEDNDGLYLTNTGFYNNDLAKKIAKELKVSIDELEYIPIYHSDIDFQNKIFILLYSKYDALDALFGSAILAHIYNNSKYGALAKTLLLTL